MQPSSKTETKSTPVATKQPLPKSPERMNIQPKATPIVFQEVSYCSSKSASSRPQPSPAKAQELEVMEAEFQRLQVQLEEARQQRQDPAEFYSACSKYYKEGSQRHASPTKRLVRQKNTTVQHKNVIRKTMEKTGNYNQFYASPGKSYIVEPKRNKAINYSMAKKDLTKFYEQVFEEEVTFNKFKNESPKKISYTQKVGKRPHGKIMIGLQKAI